jgi:YD repeat-containing protein
MQANLVLPQAYDSICELTQVTQGASTTESYTFDPVGNRTASLGVSSYTNNSSNELTSTMATLPRRWTRRELQNFWDYEHRVTRVTLPGR